MVRFVRWWVDPIRDGFAVIAYEVRAVMNPRKWAVVIAMASAPLVAELVRWAA